MSVRLLDALLRLRLDPDVEVDPLAVDDDIALADLGLRDDPVAQHHVPLKRDLPRELNSHTPVREMETGVVSAGYQEFFYSGSARVTERLLTAAELADLLAVPKTWILESARSGAMPCVRLGRYVRFDLADVEKWLETADGPIVQSACAGPAQVRLASRTLR